MLGVLVILADAQHVLGYFWKKFLVTCMATLMFTL